MWSFVLENLATIVIGTLVSGVVALVVIHMVRSRRNNPHGGSCGGCGSCPYAEGCKDKK